MNYEVVTNSAKKSILGVSKKYVIRMSLLACVIVAANSYSASAQVYVRVRPQYHRAVRPAAPSRAHVWIDEDWEYRGGHYVAVGGHWAAPPHPGWVWVPGRWVHERRGYQWVPGRWRRR